MQIISKIENEHKNKDNIKCRDKLNKNWGNLENQYELKGKTTSTLQTTKDQSQESRKHLELS